MVAVGEEIALLEVEFAKHGSFFSSIDSFEFIFLTRTTSATTANVEANVSQQDEMIRRDLNRGRGELFKVSIHSDSTWKSIILRFLMRRSQSRLQTYQIDSIQSINNNK